MEYSREQPEEELIAPQSRFAFWRRVFAFAIDGLILELISVLLALALFPLLITINEWGRMIGFAIAVLYLGICNSALGKGQTIGKRLFQVRVVDREDKFIGLARSLLRAIILCLIVFPFISRDLSGLIYEKILINWYTTSPLLFITKVVLAGVQIVALYFFILNRKTHQTLHDFVGRSVVVNSFSPQISPFPKVWKWHFVIALFLSVVLVVANPPQFQAFYDNEAEFTELTPIYRSLNNTDRFYIIHVIPHAMVFNSRTRSDTLEVILTLKRKSDFSEQTVSTVIDTVSQIDIQRFGTVLVNLSYGFSLGFVTAQQEAKYWYCRSSDSLSLQEKQETPLTVQTLHAIRLEIDQSGQFSSFSIGSIDQEWDSFFRSEELHSYCPARNISLDQ